MNMLAKSACFLYPRCPMEITRQDKRPLHPQPLKPLRMAPIVAQGQATAATRLLMGSSKVMAQPRSESLSSAAPSFFETIDSIYITGLLCSEMRKKAWLRQHLHLHLQSAFGGQQSTAYGYSAGGQASVGSGAVAQAAQGLAPEQQAKLSQIVAQVNPSAPSC